MDAQKFYDLPDELWNAINPEVREGIQKALELWLQQAMHDHRDLVGSETAESDFHFMQKMGNELRPDTLTKDILEMYRELALENTIFPED